jgi:hypothetical protein
VKIFSCVAVFFACLQAAIAKSARKRKKQEFSVKETEIFARKNFISLNKYLLLQLLCEGERKENKE